MKRILLFCLFVSFCNLWAIQPKDSSPTDSTLISEPTFNARLTIGKGIFENDSRYTGAVTTADSVTHAFAGSDITYNISVDAKGYKILGAEINLGETTISSKTIGDTLITSTFRLENKAGSYNKIYVEALLGKLGEKIIEKDSTITVTDSLGIKKDSTVWYKDTITAYIDTTLIYEIPKSKTFVLYDAPKIQNIYNNNVRISELDSYTINLNAVVRGGNSSTWNYEWVKNYNIHADSVSQAMIDSTVIVGTSNTYTELVKHTVDGNSMRIDELKYRLRYNNIAPDSTTVWFSDSVQATTIKVYNSPKPAKAIEAIKNGNNSLYIATGFDLSDEELEENKYLFVFNNEAPTSARYLFNPPFSVSSVRTLWRYEDIDCYSDITKYDESQAAEPYIKVGVEVGKGIYTDETRYKGAVKTSDGITHALAGSDVSFLVGIDTKGGELVSGTISYGKDKYDAEVSGNFLYNDFPKKDIPGVYNDITVDAILKFTFDKKQVFFFETTFKVPVQNTFVLYPKPTFPEQLDGYTNQVAFNAEQPGKENILEVNMEVLPGDGGTKTWEYVWSSGSGTQMGNGTELEYLTLNTSSVSGIVKKTAVEKVRLEYKNIAPDGSAWISGTFNYPVAIYNCPASPLAFKAKGIKNTSNIYIVTMSPISFGNNDPDNILKEREYIFRYGNDNEVVMEKDAQDPEKQSRWCNYTGFNHNNPWVETVWRYSATSEYPAFECHSIRRYANGSRGEMDGTTDIEDIWTESQDVTIYSIDGNKLPNKDIKSLQPGTYIVEREHDGLPSRVKIVVK